MEGKETVSVGRKILAIIVFWALTLLGGMLWGLLNIFTTNPESIWWIFVQVTSSAFAVAIAGEAMKAIVKESANTFCMVNCIIGAIAILVLTVLEALTNQGIIDVLRDLGGVIVALIWARIFYNNSKEQKD